MISHFYLQRAEARTQRQRGTSYDYLKEKGINRETWGKYDALGGNNTTLGEVESAMSSRGILSSVLWRKRMRVKGKAKK